MEETLNELLEQEAEQLTQAARYERSEAVRAIAADTTTVTSQPPPEMRRSMFPVSRASLLRLSSSNATAAGR